MGHAGMTGLGRRSFRPKDALAENRPAGPASIALAPARLQTALRQAVWPRKDALRLQPATGIRKLLHWLGPLLLAVTLSLSPDRALTADVPVLGIASPLSGPFAILGQQLEAGARAAAHPAGLDTVSEDDRCTAEGGADAAERFLAQGVTMVVGFLCSDSIDAALPILSEAGVPVVTPGVRATGITDQRRRTGWLVYRAAPRADHERQAVAQLLTRLWADVPFAIIDDGTIYGRDLSETLRLAAEEAALRPVIVDGYRPGLDSLTSLAARLRRAGATHVFVGGERQDIAMLGRDAAALGFGLTIAGGETLRADAEGPDLPAGTLMIGLPEPEDLESAQFDAAMRASGSEAGGYSLAGFVATQISAAAVRMSDDGGRPLHEVLGSETFETVVGRVSFDEKGDLRDNPYRLFRYDRGHFVQVKP